MSTAQRIAGIASDARAARVDAGEAIERLAELAQERGGRDGRRGDGAFFTDHDVARRLACRALVAWLLDDVVDADELIARGDDLHDAVREAPGREALAARLASVRVLDPTCGAGSFLHAAWLELLDLAEILGGSVSPAQLAGVDLDADAIAACRATLVIACGDDGQLATLQVADAERAGAVPVADVVLGNPPFVRATRGVHHADLQTARVPNRSAWIVERALDAAAPGARAGFVLPISTSCTDAFQPARDSWERSCDRVHVTHFDTIPCSLFAGVVQRVSFFEGRRRDGATDGSVPARWWTTRYHRWLREERATLLDQVRHVPMPVHAVGGSLAKVGSDLERGLLDRLFAHPPAGRWFATGATGASNRLLYKRRWSYFLLFTDFVPGIWNEDGSERVPTELKAIDVDAALDARVLLATYSSTLFWWYFSVFTDNRNVNRRDLAAFPLPELSADRAAALAELGGELMDALRACAEVRTCTYRSVGTIRNTYFRQGATRPVLDRIDQELAAAYGMSDAELAFVLAYERRFRS